jgi:ABC-2 type transport system permease protein
MAEGVRLWEFPAGELAILFGTAIGYILIGFYCFQRAEHREQDRGLLGQY